MKKKNPLIFLHLTRTGGSTLRGIIERQINRGAAYRIKGNSIEKTIEDFKNFSQVERDKIKFLSGHMPLGLHKYFSVPCDYITMLRDPIEKVISEYYYMKNFPQHTYYQTIKNMSLKDHALSRVNSVVNYQARVLSDNWGMPHVESSPLPSNALEVAKENLRKYFKVVGVMEKFDETLLVFKKVLGWKNIYYIRNNVNAKRPLKSEISQDVLDIIKKNNALDIELHKLAGQLLEDSIKKYGPSFEEDLKRFRVINKTNFFQTLNTVKGKSREFIVNCIPDFVKNRIKKVLNKN
ncbi:MAG: hypothetical protein Athens071426_314 [Parcubacteria group bacterium Athens0714_26]|nr:MAG: hypothetical protein Athens101426_82 [Parcubacteria group bacterium Athens1014_26]TSD03018.1 MAG: hypothetical protein Athens071426_314 [Parcubacteria group bacterium Athens0714_26]